MSSTHGIIATASLFIYKLLFGVKVRKTEIKQMQEYNQCGAMSWKPWGGNRWNKMIDIPLPTRKKRLGEMDILLIVDKLKGTVFFPKNVPYRWRTKFTHRNRQYFIEIDNRGVLRYGENEEQVGKVTLGYITQ